MLMEFDAFLRILRVVGVFPFEETASKMIFSRKYYAWTVLLSFATTIVHLSQYVIFNYNGKFILGARIVYVTCFFAIYTPNVVQPLFLRDKILAVVSNLKQIRSSSEILSVDFSSPPLLFLVVPFLSVGWTLIWSTYRSIISGEFHTTLWHGQFFLGIFMEHFLVMEFVVFVQRFYDCLETTVQQLRIQLKKRRKVDELVAQWDKQMDTADAFLQYFRFQMLFIVCFLLVMIVQHLFWGVKSAKTFSQWLVDVLPWGSTFIGQLLAVVLTCATTSRKASEFTKILYSHAVKRRDCPNLSNNEMVLIHLIRRRKLVFSLYGFFEIKRSFLTTVTSTCATYLFIMIQMTPVSKQED